jgi:hypothetical protein
MAKNPDYAQNPSPQHTTSLWGRTDGANLRYGLFSPVSSRFPDRNVCRADALVKMDFGFYRER